MQERLNLTNEEYNIIKQKISKAASRPYHIKFGDKANEMIEKRKIARLGKTYKELMGEEKALQTSIKKSVAYPSWGKSKYEEPIMQIFEECLGYNIDRNFWVAIPHTNKRYKIDRFVHNLHLAIEVDEDYHNTYNQVLKDSKREKEIKSVISGCKFLRLPINTQNI
jgi:hypothetical protein